VITIKIYKRGQPGTAIKISLLKADPVFRAHVSREKKVSGIFLCPYVCFYHVELCPKSAPQAFPEWQKHYKTLIRAHFSIEDKNGKEIYLKKQNQLIQCDNSFGNKTFRHDFLWRGSVLINLLALPN